MIKREFVCIVCPNSCHITVEYEGQEIKNIESAQCSKGKEFIENEIRNPLRTFTGSIFCKEGDYQLVSIKSSQPVPKKEMKKIARYIRQMEAKAPIEIGQTIIANVLNLNVDLVATRKVKAEKY